MLPTSLFNPHSLAYRIWVRITINNMIWLLIIFNKVRGRWYQEYHSEDQGRKDGLLSISVNAIDDEAVGACGDQVDKFQQ